MCEPLKTWGLALIREHGLTVIGFVFASVVYTDYREVTLQNLNVIREVSKATSVHTETLRVLTEKVERLGQKNTQE